MTAQCILKHIRFQQQCTHVPYLLKTFLLARKLRLRVASCMGGQLGRIWLHLTGCVRIVRWSKIEHIAEVCCTPGSTREMQTTTRQCSSLKSVRRQQLAPSRHRRVRCSALFSLFKKPDASVKDGKIVEKLVYPAREMVELGSSGIKVSPMGLGTWCVLAAMLVHAAVLVHATVATAILPPVLSTCPHACVHPKHLMPYHA